MKIAQHELSIKLFISTSFLLVFQSLFAQNIIWERTYGDTYQDEVFDMDKNLVTGHYILAGYTTYAGCTYWDDAYVIELNGSTFDVNWAKCYGGGHTNSTGGTVEHFENVIPFGDGYIFVGDASSVNGDIAGLLNGDTDAWIVRVDGQGEIIWQKPFGGSWDEEGYDIVETPDGGLIFTGRVSSEDGDLAGLTLNNVVHEHDVLIAKLDSSGNTVWVKNYGSSGTDMAIDIIRAHEGGYIVSAKSNTPDGDVDFNYSYGDYDFWIFKISENGDMLWQKSYGGEGVDLPEDIYATSDNGYLIVGSTTSISGMLTQNYGHRDVWVLKIDSAGNHIWDDHFGGSSADYAFAAIEDSDGNYIVCGETHSSDIDFSNSYGVVDAWAAKYNSDGMLMWRNTYGSSGYDSFKDVMLYSGKTETLLFAGWAREADYDVSSVFGDGDFWLVNIDNGDGESSVQEKSELECSIYPNPFSEQTAIRLSHPIQNGTLQLHDALGRLVKTDVVHGQQFLLESDNLPEGVYFLSVFEQYQKLGTKSVVISR